MPRWVYVILLAVLAVSVCANVVLASLMVRAWQERPDPIMCRDADLSAYSPGAILVVNGELKRCKVAGIWVDSDEWGNPLADSAEPASSPQPE